jgi:hypothetical protein
MKTSIRKILMCGAAALMLVAPMAPAFAYTLCEKAAAYQVAGEPGMHECASHKTMSADCRAVAMASRSANHDG